MKYSLSTFVYYRYRLDETLKRIKKLGYDGVEIWGGRPHAYFEDMDEVRIEKTKSLLKEIDLSISNFIPAQFRYPTNIASSDEDIRQNSVLYLKRSIDVAELLGAPYVSICPGYSMYGDAKAKAVNAMKESIEKLLKHTREYKTVVLMEPAHSMETDLIMTVQEGMELCDEFGRENLGLCIDTGHMNVNNEPLSDIPIVVKDYIAHYHIDDNTGVSDDHLVPGEGSIDFKVFHSNLRGTDYSGYLAVELGFGYTADPESASKRSIEYLKGEACQ